ncbi:MAG: helix-turn-helix transcriptional regulator [Elusimicrobia bacterium]|nr:helix-turn-helix transcriptional regulator [Elusimicrobiota bacterium]
MQNKIKHDSKYAQAYFEAIADEPLPIQMAILRRAYGISQEEIAAKLRLKQAHISRLEKKDSDHLISTYEKMAKVLHSKLMIVPENARVVPA